MSDIHSTDIVDFVPAVNAAILIDGITIIRDPDTGALVAAQQGSPTTEAGTTVNFVPPHTHLSIDVTDLYETVRMSLGAIGSLGPFFSNTPISNAVVFTFDANTSTVSADVKVDGISIVKNEYGQLEATGVVPSADPTYVAPHSHISTDVTDFTQSSRAALGTIDGAPFFVNTALTNAVVFTYNDTAKTVSADVKIDGVTIVKNEYGQLMSINTDPVDPDYVAPHDHPSTQITDFREATRIALGAGTDNTPFFVNTATSKAVVFSYDVNTHTISADIKIDNDSITKNKYGQLVAAKQIIKADDVEGLHEFIDQVVVIIPAVDQILAALAPNGQPWLDGLHNFTNVKLGDALYDLNVDAKTTKTIIDTVLLPSNPDYLSTNTDFSLAPENTLVAVLKAGTGEEISIASSLRPLIISDSFYKGDDSGWLIGYIDSTEVGKIEPFENAMNQEGAVTNGLSIYRDRDLFADYPVFHNLYRVAQAGITSPTDLIGGVHSVSLQHTVLRSGASTVYTSKLGSINTDVPASIMVVSPGVTFTPAISIRYVSGAPSLTTGFTYNLTATMVGVVGFTYGKKVAHIVGKNTSISNEGYIGAGSIPAVPDYANGLFGNADIASFSFQLLDTYNEAATITITPLNCLAEPGSPRDIVFGRIDANTVETTRVYSGDASKKYPAIDIVSGCGSAWDAYESLAGAEHGGELQKLNSVYRWPVGNYEAFGGPNYTGLSGITVEDQIGEWRWVTLKLATGISYKRSFRITFTGGDTSTWTANPYTKVTDGIMIYAKLDSSGWVDCNKPYVGYGAADTNGAAAMDASDSSAIVKRVTLGASSINSIVGDLYLRIALPSTSTKQFGDPIISDWA